MGANATTSVPKYTAGDVLTAANLSITNSGIPVFANSTDRTNAFGGTGEKTLAEGQFAYLEDDNKTYYYDGAAWQEVGGAGLKYITGAAFTTAATVSLPNGTFSSTYRNYRVIVSITDNSVDQTTLQLRMRASGTDDATGYYGSLFGVSYESDTLSVTRSNNATSFTMSARLRSTNSFDNQFIFDVINPQVAQVTGWNGLLLSDLGGVLSWGCASFGGIENSTTQFDSLTIYAGSGTITGTYRVYGYTDS